ncbi:MAG: hypothetical protein LBE48_02905 [Methanomassiliicoccaceae archaeon]|nr:hypothetical protein [Methanomassiliicoccaceae archaeon]
MTNGTGSAVKGTLTGSGKTWTLSLSSVASQGNVTIKISDFGDFAVDTASQTVAVYKDGRTHVTFTASQTGGSSGTTDSTGIVITFSDDVTGLTASDITIASGTGSAVKGALSGSGRTWTINITNVEEGDVNVAIRNFGSYAVTTVSETVDVYQGEQERFTLTSSSSSGGTIEWFDGSDWVMLPSEKDFEYGTEVKVRASNAGGYGFSYWSGHLFGTDSDPASMIMNADRHIEAFFYDESDHSVLKLDAAATGGKVMWSVGPSTPVQLSTAEVRFSKTVTVDLEAKADSGYVFRTWTGDLAGTASSKTLTMGDDRTVGAIFTDNSLDQTTNRTLSLGTLTGTGTIEYRIGSTGEWAVLESIMLPNNTTVELKASAGSGHTFRMWTGSMAGTGSSATLTMNGNKTVGALFTDDDLDQSTNRTLSAGTLTGKGTIEYRIGTNDEWTTLTSVVLPDDTAVELRSAAASGSTFRTWAGDIGGTSASLSITMNGNITIGAVFTDDSYDGRSNRTLTLSTIIGPGTVEYRVKNGTWAELLTVTVPNNTEIELRATTDIGSVFGGWAGDLSGNASQITVRMNTSRTIGAVFFEANYTITVIAEEGSTFRYTLGNDKAWEEFTIGPSGSYTIKNVPNGIVITIEAILFEGYEASWNIGDGKAIKNNTHTFTASNDQSITVTFTPPKTSTEKKDMMLWIVAILMLILVAALLIKAAASREKKKKKK